jgi:hypothetical protein
MFCVRTIVNQIKKTKVYTGLNECFVSEQL